MFNPTPEWTERFILPEFVCPTCGSILKQDEDVNALTGHTYYEARHIPDSVSYMCFNEDCVDCEKDIVFYLSAQVTIYKIAIENP